MSTQWMALMRHLDKKLLTRDNSKHFLFAILILFNISNSYGETSMKSFISTDQGFVKEFNQLKKDASEKSVVDLLGEPTRIVDDTWYYVEERMPRVGEQMMLYTIKFNDGGLSETSALRGADATGMQPKDESKLREKEYSLFIQFESAFLRELRDSLSLISENIDRNVQATIYVDGKKVDSVDLSMEGNPLTHISFGSTKINFFTAKQTIDLELSIDSQSIKHKVHNIEIEDGLFLTITQLDKWRHFSIEQGKTAHGYD